MEKAVGSWLPITFHAAPSLWNTRAISLPQKRLEYAKRDTQKSVKLDATCTILGVDVVSGGKFIGFVCELFI